MDSFAARWTRLRGVTGTRLRGVRPLNCGSYEHLPAGATSACSESIRQPACEVYDLGTRKRSQLTRPGTPSASVPWKPSLRCQAAYDVRSASVHFGPGPTS